MDWKIKKTGTWFGLALLFCGSGAVASVPPSAKKDAIDPSLQSLLAEHDVRAAKSMGNESYVPAGAMVIDDFPCTGCKFQIPANFDPDAGAPIWIALHGDEGNPNYAFRAHQDAMNDAGYLLSALQCPADLGCNSSTPTWYDWATKATHDPEWVNKQRDAIDEMYRIDRKRMYLSGFSAGSMYLSWWAIDNGDQYAGVVFETCGKHKDMDCIDDDKCKIPAYFLEGSEDFCLFMGEAGRDHMEMCGHDVIWDLVEGEEHTIISSRFPEVLDWTRDHPLECEGSDDTGTGDDNDDSESSTGSTGSSDTEDTTSDDDSTSDEDTSDKTDTDNDSKTEDSEGDEDEDSTHESEQQDDDDSMTSSEDEESTDESKKSEEEEKNDPSDSSDSSGGCAVHGKNGVPLSYFAVLCVIFRLRTRRMRGA